MLDPIMPLEFDWPIIASMKQNGSHRWKWKYISMICISMLNYFEVMWLHTISHAIFRYRNMVGLVKYSDSHDCNPTDEILLADLWAMGRWSVEWWDKMIRSFAIHPWLLSGNLLWTFNIFHLAKLQLGRSMHLCFFHLFPEISLKVRTNWHKQPLFFNRRSG